MGQAEVISDERRGQTNHSFRHRYKSERQTHERLSHESRSASNLMYGSLNYGCKGCIPLARSALPRDPATVENRRKTGVCFSAAPRKEAAVILDQLAYDSKYP